MDRDESEEAADNAAVVARLKAALANPAVTDLVVVSDRDDTMTPASAFLLASCSSIFTSMLTGNFLEGVDQERARKRSRTRFGITSPSPFNTFSSPRSVRSSFSGEALSSIVDFSATNDAPMLWSGNVRVLAEILEASEYYDIDGLGLKARRQLIARAKKVPEDACAVLNSVWVRWSADDFGPGPAKEVAYAAMEVIDESADKALMTCECLCEEAMLKVLSSQTVGVDEESLFLALQHWVQESAEGRGEGSKDAVGRLVACLSFEKMSPTFLKDVVATSGLVSKDNLFDVFQNILIKSETAGGYLPVRRSEAQLPTWTRSSSVDRLERTTKKDGFFYSLLNRSMRSGCCTWDLCAEIVKFRSIFVGVLICHHRSDEWSSSSTSAEQIGFGYGRTGQSFRINPGIGSLGWVDVGTAEQGPSFFDGDMIRFTMDCEAGTLSVQVNGCTPHKAFSGVRLLPGFELRPMVMLWKDSSSQSGVCRPLNFKRVRKAA